jgi:hypothetical protein
VLVLAPRGSLRGVLHAPSWTVSIFGGGEHLWRR